MVCLRFALNDERCECGNVVCLALGAACRCYCLTSDVPRELLLQVTASCPLPPQDFTICLDLPKCPAEQQFQALLSRGMIKRDLGARGS